MADTTEQALRAHMEKWAEKGRPGFNSSPLGKLEEKVRWLCDRLDRPATITVLRQRGGPRLGKSVIGVGKVSRG